MAVFTSMYDTMNKDKEKLMNKNKELLKDMLDFAIQELEEIAEDNEIYLIDNMKICKDKEINNELLCFILSKLKDRKALSYIQSQKRYRSLHPKNGKIYTF